MYREILSQLASKPEIHTASSGARAMAMLESQPFQLLISDLKMPKMDGLQVLSIVRRKYPELRTVVLTSVHDEEFRSRVYALGVDLFWQKPGSPQEIKMFTDCIESLLGREIRPGFRGLQSKSLVDIIQLECLSQSSSVLRITNGPLSGRIWINGGELTDAETDGARGEEAFRKILSWKTGGFETMPAEPNRPQTIFKAHSALLLETAQAFDEAHGEAPLESPGTAAPASGLALVTQVDGAEFALTVKPGEKAQAESLGLENPDHLAAWAGRTMERFGALGDLLKAGPLEAVDALGPQRHVGLAASGSTVLCVGWRHSLSGEDVRDRMKKVMALWRS